MKFIRKNADTASNMKINNKLSYRRQTARRICTNAMARLYRLLFFFFRYLLTKRYIQIYCHVQSDPLFLRACQVRKKLLILTLTTPKTIL